MIELFCLDGEQREFSVGPAGEYTSTHPQLGLFKHDTWEGYVLYRASYQNSVERNVFHASLDDPQPEWKANRFGHSELRAYHEVRLPE